MPRRIHQVKLVLDPVLGLVSQPNGLRLDRDAALALDLHRIQHLLLHLPRFQPAAGLDQPIGQRALAMVDMGNDRKIADMRQLFGLGCAHPGEDKGFAPAVQSKFTTCGKDERALFTLCFALVR